MSGDSIQLLGQKIFVARSLDTRSDPQIRRLIYAVLFLITWAFGESAVGEEARRLTLVCLQSPVEVIRDAYAIPHIYAQSMEDAYRAMGNIHATDRLLEMELFRRQAQGRMAELLGEEEYEKDLLLRRLDIRGSSEQALKSGIL
ncbi:penicillin acylase family protein, partial [Candidatus Sumerlaeota bacterium]|nr:penicillin acylase family protein [Candidatus Sumerlaeota bacterium]